MTCPNCFVVFLKIPFNFNVINRRYKMTNSKSPFTSKNFVSIWAGNARNAEYGFFNAVLYALEQFQNKNNKPLYAMIAICGGKDFKGYKIEQGYKLTQFNTPLKRILNVALSDVRIRFKEGKASVKVGENGGVNADIVQGLRTLSASKVGVKSQAFETAFPKIVKEKPQLTNEKAIDKLHTYMQKIADELGVPFTQVQAMASAKALPKAA